MVEGYDSDVVVGGIINNTVDVTLRIDSFTLGFKTQYEMLLVGRKCVSIMHTMCVRTYACTRLVLHPPSHGRGSWVRWMGRGLHSRLKMVEGYKLWRWMVSLGSETQCKILLVGRKVCVCCAYDVRTHVICHPFSVSTPTIA